MLSAAVSLQDIERRLEAEYRVMPGLRLTKPQIQRLYGLDGSDGDLVVTHLVERGVVAAFDDGRYGLAELCEGVLS